MFPGNYELPLFGVSNIHPLSSLVRPSLYYYLPEDPFKGDTTSKTSGHGNLDLSLLLSSRFIFLLENRGRQLVKLS